jgi:hypothetical protein
LKCIESINFGFISAAWVTNFLRLDRVRQERELMKEARIHQKLAWNQVNQPAITDLPFFALFSLALNTFVMA